jgi:hypothetical protein
MTIHTDPVIVKLLDKVPADMRGSFSEDQLLALKVAVGGRTWGSHALDWRWTLKWWRWQYYFVFLAGRNRRSLSQREQQIEHMSMVILALLLVLLAMALGMLGVLVLYLAKSALGIDLLPGFSFGVWGWFKDAYLQ